MRYEDEPYIRLYKRETPEWTLLRWEARVLHPYILKHMDRVGVLELGKSRWRALASAIRVPFDVLEVVMPDLLTDGCLILAPDGKGGEVLFSPNFLAAQEAKTTDAGRKRAERERIVAYTRARALGLAELAGVPANAKVLQPEVYFIRSELGGPIKIGFASDVQSRLRGLQVGRLDRLVVLLTLSGTVELEKEVHERFAELRRGGEWFEDGEALLGFIRSHGVTNIESGHRSQDVTKSHIVTPILPHDGLNMSHPVTESRSVTHVTSGHSYLSTLTNPTLPLLPEAERASSEDDKPEPPAIPAEELEEFGYDMAKRVWSELWQAKYGQRYKLPFDQSQNGEERVLQRLGVLAKEHGADAEKVLRHKVSTYLRATEPFYVNKQHKVRFLESDWNSWGMPRKARVPPSGTSPKAEPVAPPPTPDELRAQAPRLEGLLKGIGRVPVGRNTGSGGAA